MNAKRILCPCDFSDCSAAARAYALALAKESDATLFLVFVDNSLVTYDAGFAGYAMAPSEIDLQHWQDRLHEVGKTLGSVMWESHVLAGDPADRILQFAADHDIDLIVLGTHGRTGMAHLLMGSVAESIVRRATCPVLTVKQPELIAQEKS